MLACACAAQVPSFLPAATSPSASAGATQPRYTGTPFLRAWTAEDYGGAPGNRCLLQHPRTGFIYVGNNAGLLEFDGARWRLIRIPGRPTVRTLAVDAHGLVWTGNDDTICRLTPNAHGVLEAVPMRDRLPLDSRVFRSAFSSLSAPTGVFFTTAQQLLFFPHDDTASARAWPLPQDTLTLRLWWADGAPHWQTANRQTFRLRGDRIELVDAPAGWLAALDPTAPPDLTALADSLSPLGDGALDGLRLADGRLAVGTARAGLVIYDRTGLVAQRIDRAAGLPSNRIEALCEDREGGVWLALRNGLVRVQLDTPYAIHGPTQGFGGSPINLGFARSQLYVAAGEGLMRRAPAGRFQSVGPSLGGPRKIALGAGRLFVAGANLQLALPDGRFRVLDDRPHHGLLPLRTAPGVFAFGTPNGLWLGRADGETWQRLGRCPAPTGTLHAVLEHPAGVVWAIGSGHTLWRVDFSAQARPDAPAQKFTAADGLPPGLNELNTRLFLLGDQLEVISGGKLLRFDAAQNRFLPETRISGLPLPSSPSAPLFDDDSADSPPPGAPTGTSNDAPAVSIACAGPDGTAWLQLPAPSRSIFQLQSDGPDRWRAVRLPGPSLPRFAPAELLHDAVNHTLWLSGPAGLISLDLDWKPARPAPPLHAVIRRLETTEGAPLWRDGTPVTARPSAPTAPLRFAYTHDALRVIYAAPTYQADHRSRPQTFFRSKLEGLDHHWSPWSRSAQREFTNLPYRAFTLRLQARDDTGRVSDETLLAFTLAPPWWLTGWAYAVYTALAGLIGWETVRLRTRGLQRKAAALERTVADRTAELHRQNLELARLHRLELDEKISARLAEEKARLEVLRYQLNPHFLFNALNSVCSQIIRSPVAARAMVVRLADFCRLTLHRPDAEEAAMSVSEEVRLLRAYLEIEQARLGELLALEIAVDPAAESFRLPPFLLLPLVENAVKYGARSCVDRLIVRLTVRRAAAGSIEIEVANTGVWLTPGSHSAPSHGIGLENLRQRLARYFPATHEFTTTATDGWVLMRLRLLAPLSENPHAPH